MKCSLIRDLMPIYESGQCSKETESIIQEHFKTCESCRAIFEDMQESLNLMDSIKIDKSINKDSEIKDSEFWSKYYGGLILKGTGVFLFIYFVAIILRLWLK